MRLMRLLVGSLFVTTCGPGCSTLPTSALNNSDEQEPPSFVTGRIFVPTPFEGYASISGGYATDDGSHEWSLNENIVIGVVPRIGLNIEYEQLFLHPKGEPSESGFGDLRLGPEIILVHESEAMPQLSFSEIIKLGTGDEDRGLGSGTTDFTQSFGVAKAWEDLFLNASFDYTVDDAGQDSIGWSLGAEYAFKPKVYFFVELSADHPLDSEDSEAAGANQEDEEDDVSLELSLGPYFEVTPNLYWDTNISFGLTSVAGDFSVSTGLTYSF